MIGTKRKDETGEIFEVLSEPYIVETEKMVDIRSLSDGLTVCSLAWMMQHSRKVG